MKPLYQLLVKPSGERYNNKKKSGLIMNATIDEQDFHYTNRIARVIETPMIDTPFIIGDEILVHHNVFRQYWGFATKLRTSSNDLNNGTFSVPLDSVYAYKRDGDWVMIDDWILVEPQEALQGSIIYSLAQNTLRKGKLSYGALNGVEVGDSVAYTPNSEYVFDIDGIKYYKMRTRDVTCKII